MTPVLYHFGDSYSRDMLPYIQNRFSERFCFFPVTDVAELQTAAGAFVYCPTVDGREQLLARRARHQGMRLVLIADHGHLQTVDFAAQVRPDLVIHPNTARLPGKRRLELSLYEEYVNALVHLDVTALCQHTGVLVFCSQPLWEDGRPSDQFDLLRQLDRHAGQCGMELRYLRHPRERRPLPADLAHIPTLKESVAEALSRFPNWVGHDSMPLFGARRLGHRVIFLKDSPERLSVQLRGLT